MPTRNDAHALDQETDRLIAEREEQSRQEAETQAARERAEATAAARKSREASFSVVQENSGEVEDHEEELIWLRAKLRNWKERNREFLNIGAAEIAGFMLWLATPAGVVTIDLLILSYVGREVAKGATELFKGTFGGGWIVPAAVIAFTLAYVVVELAVGVSRDNKLLSSGQRQRAAQIAILLWLALPIFIVIFSLVNSGVFSANTMGRGTLTAAIVRAAGFGMFALAAHGFILFFGPAIVHAFAYVVFKVRQVRVTRRIRDLERGTRAARRNVETGVREYSEAVARGPGGTSGDAGPFSTTTTRVVNETFGAEVIETPGPPPPPRRAAQPRSAGTGHTGARDEGEDGREPPRGPENRPSGDTEGSTESGTDTADHDPEWPGTIYDMSDEDEVR